MTPKCNIKCRGMHINVLMYMYVCLRVCAYKNGNWNILRKI